MLSGISIWQLLIILAIVVLLFGTKKLRNMGKDLGGAVKGFKDSMNEGEQDHAHKKRIGEDDETNTQTRSEQDKHKDQV